MSANISDYGFMTDLNKMYNISAASTANITAKHAKNTSAGSMLDMDDFLLLMVEMLKNQGISETASTSEMLGQMVQMSVIQAITEISSMVSASTMTSNAASMVGKEVTVKNPNGGDPVVGTVTGTGIISGEQMIFINDEAYNASDVLAIGTIPEKVIEDIKNSPNGGVDGQTNYKPDGYIDYGNRPVVVIDPARQFEQTEEEIDEAAAAGYNPLDPSGQL